MVDYKKFLQVKKILEADLRKDITGWSSEHDFCEPTIEDRASAICEVFDTKQVTQSIGWFTLREHFNNTPPSPVPCNHKLTDTFGAPIVH